MNTSSNQTNCCVPYRKEGEGESPTIFQDFCASLRDKNADRGPALVIS